MNKQMVLKKFPIIKRIRSAQIKSLFYFKMYLDQNQYSQEIAKDTFQYQMPVFQDKMINTETGFPMEYQYNKVFNLKLAGDKINHLLIKPNETFSFYMAIKGAEKKQKYKEGLTLIDGKMEFVSGGGLCQLSNLLFQVFLNSPLTIIERHTHRIKDFPDPIPDSLKGVDATIAEGLLDLKVRNDTDNTFQIVIKFDEENLYCNLCTKEKVFISYHIQNRNLKYIRHLNKTYEIVDVYRQEMKDSKMIKEEKLYTNKTQIGYQLPSNIEILESEDEDNE
ncbi:MAG: VanW family protein [Clostridia bacterium]|nr:VanW family protein [Clostridia bacterium]